MLHCTGNYSGEASGRVTPMPTPIFNAKRASLSVVGSPPLLTRSAISDQARQLKDTLVNIVREDLIDKVPDAVVQSLLRVSEQLDGLASGAAANSNNNHTTATGTAATQNNNSGNPFGMNGSTLHVGGGANPNSRSGSIEAGTFSGAGQRVSIPVPTLVVPPNALVANSESPNLSPASASARIKAMDLNEIPHCRVESYNNHTSGEVSPVIPSLTKRTKSVVFFQQDNVGLEGSPTHFDAGDEGHRFVARSYSGFGSFRRASRHQSMIGGDLLQIKQRALSFHANGMPTLDLMGNDEGGIRSRFSRPIARHTDAFAADPDAFIDECAAIATSPLIAQIDVNDPDLADLLSLDYEESDVLRSVAIKVFAQYNCMRPEVTDVALFVDFVDAVSRYNNVTNPYRNGIHTAETLIGVHQYLRQPNVANNFTDSEITTLLIAALCFNLGYLGVTNEFLLQLGHPLSRAFSVVNTSESVAAMIGLRLLDQYNFLKLETSGMYWLGLLEGIADVLISSSPREHQNQLRRALDMTDRGFVSDADVPLLLSCVLRAASMRFCCMRRQQHIRYAKLWVNEAYKQSECERILGFDPTAQPWSDDTAWASVQAYVTVVAVPYFDALQEFFPMEWGEHLCIIARLYGTLESPVANSTASFRDASDGALSSLVSISVDKSVPEWSDQSSLTLSILSSIIPQHLLLAASAGSYSAVLPHRMEHYYSFLQLYDSCELDVRRRADFGGSLVHLAMQLDPLYIGEYASALVDESDFRTYVDAAALILRTEVTPDPATLMSPARRSKSQSTDAFIVLLLRMMSERSHSPPPQQQQQQSLLGGTGSSVGSNLSSFAGGAVPRASSDSELTTNNDISRERSSSMASGGPFRGKWRLTTSGKSVYDMPKRNTR